jgi:hypothetical protein
MAKEEEERKYVFSKFYKICIVILIIIGIIVSPVYPELMMRMVIGIVLAIGVFFGFGPNEAHCEYVYKYIRIKINILFIKINWSLGCPPRMFAILLSIGCYVLALYIGFKLKVI